MALSDIAIRTAKATETQFKLFDEGGLFLIVKPSGGKLWRLKYRHLGKEQQLSIGRYPDVGLKEARKRRDDAREIIGKGGNPAFEKKRGHSGSARGARIGNESEPHGAGGRRAGHVLEHDHWRGVDGNQLSRNS